jgi:multidrug resistance efflux pump
MKRFTMIAIFSIITLGMVIAHRQTILLQNESEPIVNSANRTSEIYAEGLIEGETDSIELVPTLRETVRAILCRESQQVKRGDVLIQLDDRDQRAEYELAVHGVQLATAELANLTRGAKESERREAMHHCDTLNAEHRAALYKLERAKLLIQSRSISQEEWEEAETRVATVSSQLSAARARAQTICGGAKIEELQVAEARLGIARVRQFQAETHLSRTVLVAPCDATVLEINCEVGELANELPMVVLSNTTSLLVRASVDEFDALHIQLGFEARITSKALDVPISGSVTRMSPRLGKKRFVSDHPEVYSNNRSREVWIRVHSGPDESHGLLVGLPVEIWLHPPQNRYVEKSR